jgi:hypothetical protein
MLKLCLAIDHDLYRGKPAIPKKLPGLDSLIDLVGLKT